MIRTEVIADSVNPAGNRLTTFLLVYPRFIHSELMTHRAFSRNAASSRAIPVQKMIDSVVNETAAPVSWGKNQKGMQSGQELGLYERIRAVGVWHDAMREAVKQVERLLEIGVHKQIANRLLEPFAHMTTLVTAAELENFFGLRAHKDAQPEFQVLAYEMLRVYLGSEPKKLGAGDWHLPFWRAADQKRYDERVEWLSLSVEEYASGILAACTARCARTSYVNFYGKDDIDEDIKLHNRLKESGHWSPFEHCARAEAEPVRSGNFVGFTQYRKMFPNEVRSLSRADMERLLAEWDANQEAR